MTPAKTTRKARAKLAELVLYVGAKCALDAHYGVLKLNKILFYSDFRAFRTLGAPITGVEYRKYPHGPAPRVMAPLRHELTEKGDAIEYLNPLSFVTSGGAKANPEQRLLPRRAPDLTQFTAEEIALVDGVIDWLRPLTGQEVSRISHDHLGWRLAEMEATIPYVAELLPGERCELTSKELRWARAVAKRYESAQAAASG